MLLNRFERYQQQLEHARWRVHFLLALLQTHRRLVTKRDAQWIAREGEYVRQLAEAQEALDRVERVSVVRWQEQPLSEENTSPERQPMMRQAAG